MFWFAIGLKWMSHLDESTSVYRLQMTNINNKTSCHTCREVRRSTRRIAFRIETTEVTTSELDMYLDHNLNLRMFPKQITSRTGGFFHVVLCCLARLKIGRRVETVIISIAHFSTSIKNRTSFPRLIMRRSTNYAMMEHLTTNWSSGVVVPMSHLQIVVCFNFFRSFFLCVVYGNVDAHRVGQPCCTDVSPTLMF